MKRVIIEIPNEWDTSTMEVHHPDHDVRIGNANAKPYEGEEGLRDTPCKAKDINCPCGYKGEDCPYPKCPYIASHPAPIDKVSEMVGRLRAKIDNAKLVNWELRGLGIAEIEEILSDYDKGAK